jgi:uncharacterized OB-fold protein
MTTLKSPNPTNATEEFWERTKADELVLPYCNVCEDFFFYPRDRCPICMATDLEYREASGRGTLATYTVIHRAPTKNYQEMAPYVNALVDLEEGVRLMTNLDVADESDVEIGMPLEVTFVETESEYKLPYFQPIEQ